MAIHVKYLDLERITALHADGIAKAVARVTGRGWYVLGEEVAAFEEEYARYIGTRHCVGCGNGLDALWLMLRAAKELGRLHEGDEVIVPANTYIATLLAISDNGLKPVPVEPRLDTFQIDDSLIERALTPRTKAVMLVHLYGRCAYTDKVGDICQRHGLLLFEDNAQAHGCTYQGRRTGSLGLAAAHSFYPGKNLGALGDGGAVTTDDKELAATIRTIANYGSSRKYVFDYKGRNSRLDELQAAVLREKLPTLDAENARRAEIAEYYISHIHNPLLTLPTEDYCRHSVHHIFPVLCKERDALQQQMTSRGIQTLIHYPIPPHRQRCYPELAHLSLPVTERIHREELSIPLHQTMTSEEVMAVVEALNNIS